MTELHNMTDDPRNTDPGEDSPAGNNGAGGSPDPEGPPATASAATADPAPPPEAPDDRDAPAGGAPRSDIAAPDEMLAAAGPADVEDAPAAEGEAGPPALTGEQQRLVDLETEIAELRDRSLRAMAEADNARKRAARDVADSRKYGATGLARDILTVADNLGRALEAVPEIPREEDENLFNLRAGVDMTLQEMLQALERHGVKRVTPETGERFDHNRHQAMFEVPTDDLAPGAVAQVVQDGYVIHDRLLRPALVGVARKPPEEVPPETGNASETSEDVEAPAPDAGGSAAESDAA